MADISSSHVVVFQLANEWFALPVEQVRAVERWRPPTPVPGTPGAMLGLINQRGALVALVDVRVLLGLGQEAPMRSTRLLFAVWDDIHLALVADRVADLLDSETLVSEAAPSRYTAMSLGLLKTPFGVASILDLEAVIKALRVNY